MKYVYQITENVFWMPFPKQNQIEEISSNLNKQFGHHYYIWNLSEHDYQRDFFQNQVSMHSYPGFACPPLYELLLICKCILEWVSSDGNVAIVHCQSNKGRSAILLSILWTLLFKTKISESYYIVSKAINVTKPLKSQLIFIHRYLTKLFQNIELNTQQIRVKSVILSHIPYGFKQFRPYFQILNRSEVLYEEKDQIINENQQCIFILPNLPITQDIVFRCKHITENGELIPFFRFQINTGFLFKNFIRFTENELDLCYPIEKDFYIDLVYLRGNDGSMQGKEFDHQTKEGCSLIAKLLEACSNLSDPINQILFNENKMNQEYQEIEVIKPQQFWQDDLDQPFENNQQQIEGKIQQIEMIAYNEQKDKEDEEDEDDIII